MKAIERINPENIIAIDIETVRLKESYFDLSEEYQSAWEYKNKNKGVVPTQEELAELWVETASLYAEFSKICAISIAFLHKGELLCKGYVSTSEMRILKEFHQDMTAFFDKRPNLIFVGHASIFFDYPFICKRYMINRLPVPTWLDESDKKPWEKRHLCTNELWMSFGKGLGSSLQALCTAFEIPISKVDLVGDGVGKAYYENELVRISDYCSLDAIATFNLFLAFKREPHFSFDCVVYKNKGEVLEPVPFLSEISSKKTITQEQAFRVVEFCRDLTVEQIEIVRDILVAALSNAKGVLKKEHKEFIEKL